MADPKAPAYRIVSGIPMLVSYDGTPYLNVFTPDVPAMVRYLISACGIDASKARVIDGFGPLGFVSVETDHATYLINGDVA